MIKVKDSNNTTHNITQLYKDGHEAHRLIYNDRLVFSPFLIMGTTYESTSKQMWSRGENSQLGTDLYSTFEILGEVGTDEGGTYYNFGWRVTGVMRNGNMAIPGHFRNEIGYFFEQRYSPLTTYFRTVDQFNCTGNYTYDRIPILGQRTGLKEVDFKWFNCKDMFQFIPLSFATNCTSIKNLDKVTFNRAVNCRGAFSSSPVDTFVWYSDTLYYINDLQQAWQNCSNVTLITFATQEQDNTLLRNFNSTFLNCSHVTRIDLANLKPVNLTACAGTFQGCTVLDSNPLGGVDTSGVTNWSSCYKDCKAITGGHLSTNDYSGAVSMADTFRGCTSIETMDLSGQTLSNLETMSGTWYGCTNLYSISFPSSKVRPITMQGCFASTALYGIPANIDFSRCVNTQSAFANCANFEGVMDYSNLDFSAVTQSDSMFTSCKNVYSYTFKQGAFHNSTSMNAMFERNTLLTSVTNLDMTSLTNLNSIFYLDNNLLQVTGTKPTSAVRVNWFLHGCSKLQRFIDLSNLKVKNNTQFGVGSLPSLNNDLHIETWTNEDGTGKPIVWIGQFYGFPTILTEDLTHEYNIDPQGWTFLSKQGTTNNNAFLIFSNCKYPIINLDKIKVRMMNDSSGNAVPIKLENAFTNSNITEIDTTNWLDNSEISSLTKVVIATNSRAFQRCKNLTTIKLKNVMLQENYDVTTNNTNNLNIFDECPAVTSFECDVDFINTQRSQVLVLNFPLWTNATEIEAFLTQLATTNSRRKTHGDGNNTVVTFSTNTYNVITSLPNWSTLSSAMVAHGWSIGN